MLAFYIIQNSTHLFSVSIRWLYVVNELRNILYFLFLLDFFIKKCVIKDAGKSTYSCFFYSWLSHVTVRLGLSSYHPQDCLPKVGGATNHQVQSNSDMKLIGPVWLFDLVSLKSEKRAPALNRSGMRSGGHHLTVCQGPKCTSL